jgi:hypothetical protein
MDAHLLIDEIQLSEGDVELTGCEEGAPLCSISVEVTGDARFNSRGLRGQKRGGYMRCGDWGRGDNISCCLLVSHDS